MDIKRFELTELKEKIAKWLFTNRSRFPNQRFYANWYDETTASPLTEREYLNLAGEVLSHFEPVELRTLEDEEIKEELVKYAAGICQSNPIKEWNQTEVIRLCIQATICKNQKGQLYRIREGK